MFRAVPDRASARSTCGQSVLSATPFAHHRYTTRFPRASASGRQRFMSSGLTSILSEGVLGTTTSKRDGLSSTSANGLSRTTVATSLPERTVTRELMPHLEASRFSIRAATSQRLSFGREKTTFPLLSTVRTSRNPRPSTSARRSVIAIRFAAPMLFTPRRSATTLPVKSRASLLLCDSLSQLHNVLNQPPAVLNRSPALGC